ncbi:MAG: methyltransferase domain-containing protein [Phycisphaerae bacterium]|nr:methyltransferase domain-containing protein [Phycisphaerae bacterium]
MPARETPDPNKRPGATGGGRGKPAPKGPLKPTRVPPAGSHPPRRDGPNPTSRRLGPPRGVAPHPRPTQGRLLNIVHEDDDLLVVDKPPGLLSASPEPQRQPTLFDLVKQHVRDSMRRKTKRGQGPKAYIIHRLDREASGLLVFAKSERAFIWLKEDFKAKRVHRNYLALAEGVVGPPGHAGTVQTFLIEDDQGRVTSMDLSQSRASDVRDQAKLAVTHYRVVAAANDRTLLNIRLETGRKHQIRVHLARLGHPLVGDPIYRARTDPLRRLGLHACDLGFKHPATGMSLRFHSDATNQFYGAVSMTPPSKAAQSPTEMHRTLPEDDAPVGPAFIPDLPLPREAHPTFAVAGSLSSVGSAAVIDQEQRSPGSIEGSPTNPSGPAPRSSRDAAPPASTSWDAVAPWYDSYLTGGGSDHYTNTLIPGTLRLVQPRPGARLLDLACGQGILTRALAESGAQVLGVDSSPRLLDTARKHPSRGAPIDYRLCDARELDSLGVTGLDACTCLMGLGNIDPLDAVLPAIARALRPGGAFVFVVSHPAFRAPVQSSWGWDPKANRQYRRLDGYLSSAQHPIAMHPGKDPGVTTWTFHRPLQTYVRLLAEAGLVIDALEEWPGQRASQPGPRAAEENRARREIPLFLAVRARRLA